nr:dnaJ homolog subfamily C member 30 [Ciona intestinalis]|eukprot:XP_026690870.1 dnaJ homolog subfamily C member 30 [Ciona intestinalis]
MFKLILSSKFVMSRLEACARVYGPLMQRLQYGKGHTQYSARHASNKIIGPLTPILIKQYCDLLGVSVTASEAKIKQAFYRKSLQVHPDHNKSVGSEERFTELSNAYQALIEDKKKFNRSERSSFIRKPNQNAGDIRPWFQSNHVRTNPTPTPTKHAERTPSKYKDFHNYNIDYSLVSTGVDKIIQNYGGTPGTWCNSYYQNQMKVDFHEHKERRRIEKEREKSKDGCIVM